MAIPKRGSRLITVDGVRYRWRIGRHSDDYAGTLTIVAEPVDNPGSVLSIHVNNPPGLRIWQALPFRPRDVARCIRQALTGGWDATTEGKAFVLHTDAVTVPDAFPPQVVELAMAVRAGADCTFALHDALLEAGFTELVDRFRAEWRLAKGGVVVDLILSKHQTTAPSRTE